MLFNINSTIRFLNKHILVEKKKPIQEYIECAIMSFQRKPKVAQYNII